MKNSGGVENNQDFEEIKGKIYGNEF